MIVETIPQITIRHNHGVYVLKDAKLLPYGEGDCRKVKGTVVEGHSTSRLFGHSSTSHEAPGTEMEVDIWNRRVHAQYGQPEGHMTVSIEFCG